MTTIDPIILGVDPGQSGALAFLGGADGLVVIDMPKATGAALGALIRDLLVEARPVEAWVEQVGYMPGQRGGWTFAEGYGVVLGTLGAWDVPVRHLPASTWKKAVGLTKRKGETKAQTKTRSRQLAMETWPHCAHLFTRVKDDGRAEAALIARYGRLWTTAGGAAA